jgi:outer membrane biosynthesis protein TonB
MSMRQAFAACMAFLILMAVVAVRFGCKDSPLEAPAQPIVDAGIADAPVDGAAMLPDAAPTPKKQAPKPKRKPTATRPEPKPTPKPPPVVPPPVVTPPVVSPPVKRCTQRPNPAGCPASEPNINRPCDADGVQCVYGTSCCPPVYVCNNGAFEAWFTSCP